MSKNGFTRRQFVKAGLLTSAGAAVGAGVLKPTGLWAAPAKIKGPVKVGYQAIMSGTLAGYGEFHKMGATMAMEEINKAGGIAGVPLEVEFRDSTLKKPQAIKNARYFVDSWGADFLAGVDSSGQALALAPVMAQLGKPLMVTHAATEKLTEIEVFKKGIKEIFRICTPTYQDGNAAAFVAQGLPAKKWATISPKYEYGYTCWKMFKGTLGKLKPGTEFVAESWAPFGTTDFRPHINTIMDAKPDGLYSVEWAGELITMIKQAKQAGLFKQIKHIMLPVGAAMDVLEGLGSEMPDGVWISGRYFFMFPNDQRNIDWVARFRKRWNHYPAYVSETGYSAMFAYKQAVEAAGSKEAKAVIGALEGMKMGSPAGERVFRKEDHQAMYEVPWGLTASNPKYPFKVMGKQVVIPPVEFFNRPPFEGPGTHPPFKG
ncbi:MAG: ABC transporter substrate-binding protein [Desulfarculaceae bacterium]|nr:ABC transporter substrate-binding protein [Desulfarculaceae bacterium]MCF8074067.1 ABC transporter substrate-binding protein [Desulfarculaceae bacterium]MCF8102095.1 ABC transporter substrate-binding protein [Desulfarculaceae bacterium]MCF8117633.1 ABC transporter substrate-binding protein [Desulfarculaceae bacterium]